MIREASVIKAATIELTVAADARGLLAAAEFPSSLPFIPRRVFMVSQSPPGTERGGHAHRICHQVLVATSGSVAVEYDDDEGTHVVTLVDATIALHIPPLVWARQRYATRESSLLVLASHEYDTGDYVDDRTAADLLRRERSTQEIT